MKQHTQNHFKSIIIGAGASGLMCAEHISDSGSVLILEKQPQIAAQACNCTGNTCTVGWKYYWFYKKRQKNEKIHKKTIDKVFLSWYIGYIN